ncbi:MAG TPA: hypothetical protein VGR70_02005 [Stellaceae bacterium]|nr:hypothetical protein [Stellaceae bacterium]
MVWRSSLSQPPQTHQFRVWIILGLFDFSPAFLQGVKLVVSEYAPELV